MALAEAMYCGTPAATFSIEGSGVNWVSINNETCLEAPNRDVDAYARNINTLLFDNALYDRLAQAGKERAERMFTIPKMIEACEISYNKISNMNVMKFSRRGVKEYLSIPLAMSNIHAAHNVERKLAA